jgi:hypothetical protein
MTIDQRNAGASVSVDGAGVFTVDRWIGVDGTDGAFTVQQDASAPAGFTNSIKITVSTADGSLAATQTAQIRQEIEGFNTADLGWGTANAKTVTLSFWVRSSLTGTFGGSLRNSATDRSYPYSYTISVADTWEQKSVTIEGDTSGTWLTTNGIGIRLTFSLGAGTDRSGTAGAWNSNNNVSSTGAVSVIGTLSATWYLTGCQLEVGTQATSFEYRQYQQELALCQRYYQSSYDIGTAAGAATTTGIRGLAYAASGVSSGSGAITFQTVMRSSPTIVTYDGAGTANNVTTAPNNSTTFTNGRAYTAAPFAIATNSFFHQGQQAVGNVYNFVHFTASSEL